MNEHGPDHIDPFADFEPVTPYVVPTDALPSLGRRRRGRLRVVVVTVVLVVAAGAGGFVAGRMTADTSSASTSSSAPAGDWSSDEDRLLAVALTLHQQGDLAAAEQAYNALLTMNPNNEYAHYNLGVIRQGEGKLDEAITHYDEALTIDPEMIRAHYNRGLALRDVGRGNEGLTDLQYVVDREPENAAALYNLGNLMIAEGDASGTDLVMKAVELDPSLGG